MIRRVKSELSLASRRLVEVDLKTVLKVTCERLMRTIVSVSWGHPLSCSVSLETGESFWSIAVRYKWATLESCCHLRWYRAEASSENQVGFQRTLFLVV